MKMYEFCKFGYAVVALGSSAYQPDAFCKVSLGFLSESANQKDENIICRKNSWRWCNSVIRNLGWIFFLVYGHMLKIGEVAGLTIVKFF